MNRLLLLVVLALCTLGVSAQHPTSRQSELWIQQAQRDLLQSEPPHDPKACAPARAKMKDRVPCDCKLTCDEHGDRIENRACAAYCDKSLCACWPLKCCPDGHEGH